MATPNHSNELHSHPLQEFLDHVYSLQRRPISMPLFIYLRDITNLLEFFHTIVELSSTADKLRVFLDKVLANEDVDFHKLELEEKDEVFFRKIKENKYITRKMLICGICDNFLSYISDIMLDCSKKQPAVLKSSMQLRTDSLLEFTKMRDLRNHIAERTIHDLSYKGINEIDEYIKSRLGCEIFHNQDERDKASFFIEARNLYTHNRGIVNDIFKRRVSKHVVKFRVGRVLALDYDDIIDFSFTLNKTVERLDASLKNKFNLQAKKYSTWQKRS